jgi:thymidylate synthase
MNHEEFQYLNLIKEILQNGTREESRNGTTISLFGKQMEFSLSNGTMPMITTKQLAWRTCFRELMWFIRGCTDNTKLQEQNVKIWNENASREFLDSRGLTHLDTNDLGPVYGHQWRHFNATYSGCNTDYNGKGIDQLQNVINQLKDPSQHTSRRIIMSAWNPCQIDEMALPPCHVLVQFKVRESKFLSCLLYQRSGDVGLGVPFNIASYSFLTHILAHFCNLVADKFVYVLGDAHIYENHIEALQTQLLRTPHPFPQIKFTDTEFNPQSIEEYSDSVIEWLVPYRHCGKITMQMSA